MAQRLPGLPPVFLSHRRRKGLNDLNEDGFQELADRLNFREKVERSLQLLGEAFEKFGTQMIVAHSLGKDSCVVWDLAKRVDPRIPGFIITTRFKPEETVAFMHETVARYPELRVFRNDVAVPDRLYETDPQACCDILKVEPIRRAIEDMQARCWVTGLRCTEGRTRTDFQEIEERDRGLLKLNPILIWHEREIWQYLALRGIPANPLYDRGYRSLGCAPCTAIVAGPEERAGRWSGTSKCGGECGIHTRPLVTLRQQTGERA